MCKLLPERRIYSKMESSYKKRSTLKRTNSSDSENDPTPFKRSKNNDVENAPISGENRDNVDETKASTSAGIQSRKMKVLTKARKVAGKRRKPIKVLLFFLYTFPISCFTHSLSLN